MVYTLNMQPTLEPQNERGAGALVGRVSACALETAMAIHSCAYPAPRDRMTDDGRGHGRVSVARAARGQRGWTKPRT